MDISQLKFFLLVAKTKNFSEAARRSTVTQPTISRQIVELEKELNCQLFTRDRRNVALTVSGVEFLPYAKEIVELVEKGSSRVHQLECGSSGQISICTLTTSNDIVSYCVRSFSEKYPDVLIDTMVTNGARQLTLFNDKHFDFFFTLKQQLPSGDAFEYLTTSFDHLCVIMPSSHPLSNLPLDFSLLHEERFISTSAKEGPVLFDSIMDVCHHRGYNPLIRMQYDRPEDVLHSVKSGLGISIIPEAIYRVFPMSGIKCIRIPGEDAKREYILVWRRKIENLAVQRFLDVVKPMFYHSLYHADIADPFKNK